MDRIPLSHIRGLPNFPYLYSMSWKGFCYFISSQSCTFELEFYWQAMKLSNSYWKKRTSVKVLLLYCLTKQYLHEGHSFLLHSRDSTCPGIKITETTKNSTQKRTSFSSCSLICAAWSCKPPIASWSVERATRNCSCTPSTCDKTCRAWASRFVISANRTFSNPFLNERFRLYCISGHYFVFWRNIIDMLAMTIW